MDRLEFIVGDHRSRREIVGDTDSIQVGQAQSGQTVAPDDPGDEVETACSCDPLHYLFHQPLVPNSPEDLGPAVKIG